jgi:transposase
MNSLALKVQQCLGRDPHGGEVFCFRGRKGDLIKVLWHDGVGMSLYVRRLEAGKFIWPASQNGAAVPVSAVQLGQRQTAANLLSLDRRSRAFGPVCQACQWLDLVET